MVLRGAGAPFGQGEVKLPLSTQNHLKEVMLVVSIEKDASGPAWELSDNDLEVALITCASCSDHFSLILGNPIHNAQGVLHEVNALAHFDVETN